MAFKDVSLDTVRLSRQVRTENIPSVQEELKASSFLEQLKTSVTDWMASGNGGRSGTPPRRTSSYALNPKNMQFQMYIPSFQLPAAFAFNPAFPNRATVTSKGYYALPETRLPSRFPAMLGAGLATEPSLLRVLAKPARSYV
jgi:hypothetical protein